MRDPGPGANITDTEQAGNNLPSQLDLSPLSDVSPHQSQGKKWNLKFD